jgi:hypothetical protein
MTALVSVAASFWGKALCEYPVFLGVGDSRVRGFEIITREILTIENQKPIGFI